jgi:hypothetical protein
MHLGISSAADCVFGNRYFSCGGLSMLFKKLVHHFIEIYSNTLAFKRLKQ